MKAISLDAYVKNTDQLSVSNVPDPTPKDDEYLIDVHSAAVNFYDLLQVRGQYQWQPPFPFVAGFEFSGIVTAAGKDAKLYKAGDAVFGSAQGAFANKVVAKDNQLQKKPEALSFTDAAGLFATASTSYAALTLRAHVKPGDVCLIHGAAGGVGLNAVQFAHALGGKVIAVTTGKEQMDACERFGAAHVIDYVATPKWEDEVLRVTDGRGVNAVFDPVGLIERSVKVVAWNATLVIVGFVGGQIEKLKANRILLKNINVVGLHWGAYQQHEPERVPEVWQGIFDLIAKGKFKPAVYQGEQVKKLNLIGIESIPKAMQLLENKAAWGKIVIPLKPSAAPKL